MFKIKNKINILFIVFITMFFSTNAIAAEIKLEGGATITILSNNIEEVKDVNRTDVFNFLGGYVIKESLPKSYKYIDLKFTDIREGTTLYRSLQKMVYIDVLNNNISNIGLNKTINSYYFYKIVEKIINVNLIEGKDIKNYKNRNTNVSDLKFVFETLKNIEEVNNGKFTVNSSGEAYDIRKKFLLLMDVYKTLNDSHYSRGEFEKVKLIEGAITGLTKATKDKFSTYFPPVENANFFEELNGTFEGIGAYVDMEQPGELKIVSPISGSPAEKSGLKGGDVIYKIGDITLTEEMSLTEIVSYIKGKAGTKVLLFIKRGKQKIEIEVTRGKIIIKDVEGEKLGYSTYYIKLKMFGDLVSEQFEEELVKIQNDNNIKKIIIDVRNNPGGFLVGVTDMLSHFVLKGENTAVVKYLKGSKNYVSTGKELIDFSKYKLILLQNSGSASASEILVGTIKDYYPDTTIIGEKSYGKGSVQTIKNYYDGSSLKYTIARWYTGKTETGIDKIGINADIELELDIERFNNGYDNQLEKAKSLR